MATIVAKSTPPAWAEPVRVWMFKTFFTNLVGVTFHDWWKALRENRFAIDPPYWPRAAVITVGSLLNSLYNRREEKSFKSQVEGVTVQPPLFILGHWRSGTTLLHNLLALDDQFAYPNLYEVFFPHTFLSTEDVRIDQVDNLIPSTRVMDNVAQGLGMPNEDEFATCAASLISPYMMWSFPRRQEHYEKYLTFRGVAAEEVDRWRLALLHFMKKLTLRYQRPIVLKSPPHTCRIKLLLELFPDARFLHIRRDPYTVFQSTRHLNETLTRALQFQKGRPEDLDDVVLRRYRVMHDAYFEERPLIAEGRFYELSFEDLETNPLGAMRLVYEKLGLLGFDRALPHMKDYVDSLAGYRKNTYPELEPALRARIQQAWRRNFEEWGYPL